MTSIQVIDDLNMYKLIFMSLLHSDPQNQDWLFIRAPEAASFLINITFTNNQFCAAKFARGVINITKAVNVTSNTTATLPKVVRVSNTSVKVSGVQHCVEYEGNVWVSYPGLGNTSAKKFTNTDMLCK